MPRYRHPPFNGTQLDKLHAKLSERHLARGSKWRSIDEHGRPYFNAANKTPTIAKPKTGKQATYFSLSNPYDIFKMTKSKAFKKY
eukprot:SAG11_NODE_7225_length_1175_cov_39.176580_2_plen_85_part_00